MKYDLYCLIMEIILDLVSLVLGAISVSYTHLTLPTIA